MAQALTHPTAAGLFSMSFDGKMREPQKLDVSVALALSLLVFAGPAAVASTINHATQKRFGDWIAFCDNTLACSAVQVNSWAEPLRLVVSREGQRGAPVILTLGVTNDLWDTNATEFILGVPRRPEARAVFPVTGVGPLRKIAALSGEHALKFIRHLAQAAEVKLLARGSPGSTGVRRTASIAGLRHALDWIDQQQGAIGTTDAFVAIGNRPFVAHGKLPPTLVPSPAISQAERPPLPGAVKRRASRSCDAGLTNIRPLVLRLANDMYLWGLPCLEGPYNIGFEVFLADRHGGHVRRPPIGSSPTWENFRSLKLIWNPQFDAAHMTLKSKFLGRALGDCGEFAAYVWSGTDFEQAWHSRLDDCESVERDWWPTFQRAQIARMPLSYSSSFSDQ